ncbi:MAG: hypothetical protein ACRESE_04200 [Gammaproteobacteria bacterium]
MEYQYLNGTTRSKAKPFRDRDAEIAVCGILVEIDLDSVRRRDSGGFDREKLLLQG